MEVSSYGWPVRVYYEDTDHGGVVYYANYLKFMERCRTEMLRDSGLEQDQLIHDLDLIFAVRKVEIDYLSPAKFNDKLIVTAEVCESSQVRLKFKQNIFRINENKKKTEVLLKSGVGGIIDNEQLNKFGLLLCSAEISVVSLSASHLRPKRVPKSLLQCLVKRSNHKRD